MLLTFTWPAVLPDAERMHHSYVNMVFDNDPTAEHERLAKLSNKQRRRISGMVLVPGQCSTLVYMDVCITRLQLWEGWPS